MSTIQWRPQVNALTKPVSYRIQIVLRNIAGYDEMAADISTEHPVYNEDLVRSLAPIIMEWIQGRMINGDQVTLPDAFIFRVTAQGRLDSPDDPLPGDEDMLQVSISGSRDFLRRLREAARMERLPMNEKLPHINSAQDTKLKLADVLNPAGLLHLSGSNLFFDEEDPDCSCVLRGTESGETQQSTFGIISNSEILLAPDIPAQSNPWNNEYTISVTTQYTEHGTPRTGTYQRRLRTPLAVPGLGQPESPETGILSGSAATPCVVVIGGSVSANERLRIQVIQDLIEERLMFSLINIKDGGAGGAQIPVSGNGAYTLPGFSGSAVSSLDITVNDYTALWKMVRNSYQGRLVDILDVGGVGNGTAGLYLIGRSWRSPLVFYIKKEESMKALFIINILLIAPYISSDVLARNTNTCHGDKIVDIDGNTVEDCAVNNMICVQYFGGPTCECPPPNTTDCAGVCNGSAVLDCLGVCNGAASIDCTGNCVVNRWDRVEFDCAGVCGGDSVMNCGVCTLPPLSPLCP